MMGGGRIQESNDQEKEESFGLDLEIPDTSGILKALDEGFKTELKREHADLNDKTKKAQKQGGTICFCMVETCSIGPFQAKE